jgi:sulfide:quinone oxidoreductase
MTDLRRVTDTFSVAPQLAAEDFAELKALGVKTVIGNRPDGESPHEMQSDEAEAAAAAAGIAYVYAPFQGTPTEEAVEAVMNLGPGPVVAYCRSGTRSITAWALAQAKSGAMDADSIVRAAEGAGYNLGNLKEFLRSLAAR